MLSQQAGLSTRIDTYQELDKLYTLKFVQKTMLLNLSLPDYILLSRSK